MVVDQCRVSEITEDIENSVVDDKACSSKGTVPGDNLMLNVLSPGMLH